MVHMFTVLLQEHKDTLKMMHTTKCRRDVVFSQTVSFINLFFFKYQLKHHSYFRLFVLQLSISDLNSLHSTLNVCIL